MPPHPGEVWLADLGLAAKTRPVVVVSRDDPDPPRALLLYVPLTTQHRQSPYEVVLPRLPFLEQHSVANVQGLGSLPTVRLERRLGTLPDATMVQNPALPERILYSRVGGGDTAPETLTPAGTTGPPPQAVWQPLPAHNATPSASSALCCDALARWIMPAWYNGYTADTSSEKSRDANG
jgi:mRNA interferase MazF